MPTTAHTALTELAQLLHTTPSLQKQTHKQLSSLVAITVTSKKSKDSHWLLDATTPTATLSEQPPDADSPDADSPPQISITVAEPALLQLMRGKTSAQRLYLAGKLKIRGNVMKAAPLESLLRAKAKL